ncbi:hypothetical protein ACF061_37255 [Streptomyces sp. NPDC015220]|uniref:hypothetical protein n=1 Tax=Streptomyces sp. NPDC015220 TaxID=3364947 RepID=UPI0036FCA601
MNAAGSWPRWSLEGETTALAKYVLPDEVAALLPLPGPPADSRIEQVRGVYEALAGAGITYSHEAPSDDPGRQVIRQPGEVLWCPKHATCLDLALALAGACLHSGLHPLVLLLDAPEAGRAAHALLGVWIDTIDPDVLEDIRVPDADVWTSRPDGWEELVQTDVDGPRPLLLLDPVGVAHALPSSPILGTSATFAQAARAGARYAREWTWRLAVDVGRAWRQRDTHTPAHRPEDQPLRPPYVELDPQVHRPLQMLRAEHAVVPFQGRDELTILTDWCKTVAAGPHTGVTVIHGAGGAGKTRLALELAHQLATREGWYTGYLREHTTGRDWLGTVVSPTLIVLDYADARTADAEHLLAILKRRMERGAAPAVVILTARAINGQWLTKLRKAWERDGHLVREGALLHLPPEHPAGAAIFRRAARAFHHGPDADLDLEAAERAAPADWTTLDHILLALLVARSPGRRPTTREDLYEEVLSHERAYWAQTYNRIAGLPKDADAPLEVLNRSVTSLILRAPTTRKEVHAALRTVDDLRDDPQWRETIRTTLTTCLQPGPGEPLVLRPDPIADHLTLHELRDDEDLLPSILDGLEDDRLLAALRQLNRAAAAAPGSAARMLAAWVSAGADRWEPVLQVAAEQGGTALAALGQLIDDPAVPWLDDLSRAIPYTAIGLPQLGLHTDLRRLSLLRSDHTTQPAKLADQLLRTGNRYSAAGDRQAALASVAEAVDHYRALAQADPAVYLPHLASSLNNLSVEQGEVGDRQAALASVTEAVDHYRALAQAGPTVYLPDLAMSLNNLSIHQGETGDRQAALASVTEAVEIRRTLAGANPAAYLPDLASSLNNLSVQQGATGDRQAALASITEAVDHYRTLVEADPTVYLPNLAMSLNNLSIHQGETGDRQTALASITEAVEICRTLAGANPAVYLPYLAGSLNNLSNRQGEAGDRQAALASVTEAVDHYRTLVKASPAVYLSDLAGSLNNLSNQQGAVGDRQAALASVTEAVDHYRTLVKASPAVYLPDLAGSLNNLSNQQGAVGDRQAALASVTEAVDHYRTLVKASPAAYLPDLAMSLNNLSNQQGEAGEQYAALASVTEAVDHYRALAQASPAAYLPNLAMSLNNLSNQQGAVGDRQAALASVTEAVEIRRALVKASPAAYLPDLAGSLNNLSVQQGAVGDRQAALASVTEAVEIRRALVKASPAAYLPDLAMSLNNLSVQQGAVGDRQAALASVTEAVEIRRALVKAGPAAYLPVLAGSLNNLSVQQSEAGDRQAALASVTEAVDHYRTLVKAGPAAYLPDLAMSLNNLSVQQSEAGDRQAALVSVTEAVDHYRALVKASPAAYLPDLAMSLNNLSNRQGEVGDRQAALASITEAVEIRRTLAKASPAAYLPNLATSLNNLSVQQSEAGDRQAALASVTEAVDHYRTLAKASPAAYLPNLATSLHNLSDQQSKTEVTFAAWEGAITDLELMPLAQAELRAHYAMYLAAHIAVAPAADQLVRAALACAGGSPSLLGRARQQVRVTAASLGIQDPRLPDWAVAPLPDDVVALLNQWVQAADWPSAETFLRAHADRLRQPGFRHHLELADALFPESPAIGSLTSILGQVDTDGIDTVLDRGRHDHDVRQLLLEWIATPTWADSKSFFDEHSGKLRTPEARALLATAEAPPARLHLAILQLTDDLPPHQVYEIVTERDVAAEQAFTAIDQAALPRLRHILHAHPDLLTDTTGAFFATVIAAADGDTDQARRLAQAIAEHGTDTQRHAYAIRLRTLARLAPGFSDGSELADLVHPDKRP